MCAYSTLAPSEANNEKTSQKDDGVTLWHARLGNVSGSKIELLTAAVDGVPALSNGVDGVFCGCASGKMSANPFQHTPGSVLKTLSPFEVVHSDVMGPIRPPSRGGAKYMVSFIGDYTRYDCVYFIPSKSQVFDRFKEFNALVHAHYGRSTSVYAQTTAVMGVDDSKRSKLDPKAHRCIFLGYAVGSKAYRVWDLDEERLVTTRTVQRDERPPSPT
ncbi:hypothetical protein PsorP6_011386 [Peronosclerospora sorghi]|uniref:Uncharacterized protein n=1 Tax=Peronosclerospora sorghi TaxID=230839 RepID=A0ACC0WI37_9STRA|nr:hypothetical protein PsorP6_011386 [Peronosclerospora sorghi]